jgi:DNA replication licensing factor MCM5
VLAAANPVFGTYDDQRTPFENIEFQSTILSRYARTHTQAYDLYR